MPVEEHGCARELYQRLGKEATDPPCPIGDEQQGAERSQAQEHGGMQLLEEGCPQPLT